MLLLSGCTKIQQIEGQEQQKRQKQWKSRSNGSVSVRGKNLWYAALMQRGDFTQTASCRVQAIFKEWHTCWGPIKKDIDSGNCIVYSFGVADYDEYTFGMARLGCKVYAFDPGENHPKHMAENITFHRYGLLTGARSIDEEKKFKSSSYGSTDKGEYKTMQEIQQILGHGPETQITALKVDCEGCEWYLFSTFPLRQFKQIHTELHFSTTLRFDESQLKRMPDVRRALSNFSVAYHSRNYGVLEAQMTLYQPLLSKGAIPRMCCREVSFIRNDMIKYIF
jgi:hypothetical protein